MTQVFYQYATESAAYSACGSEAGGAGCYRAYGSGASWCATASDGSGTNGPTFSWDNDVWNSTRTDYTQYYFTGCQYGPASSCVSFVDGSTGVSCTSSGTPPASSSWTEKSLGQPKDGQCTGNPCNAGTGNKYQNEEDYRSGDGRLVFTRAYNSQANEEISLGYNWTSSSHKRLEISSSLVQIRRPDDRGEPFTCPGSGSCQGDSDTQLSLSEDASGYTLTLRNGTTERYKLNGQIVSETSPFGQITSYGYDANGRLSTVTDASGHTLTFGYDTNSHLYRVTDPAGNPIGYTYDSNNNLTQVNYPDGTAKIYYYEDTNNPHSLTGIAYVDSTGTTTRFGTYGYYYNSGNTADPNNGKAILTEHATTTNGSPQEAFSLSYNSSANQTTVTDAVGTQELLTFSTNLDAQNLVTKTTSIDTKSLQQVFDTNNNLACRKDEEGHVTTYTYNATNQKLSMTEGLAGDCSNLPTSATSTSATRTTNYQYLSAMLDLPTLISSPSVAGGSYNKTTTIQYTDTNHPNLPTAITVNGYAPSGTSVSRSIGLTYYDSGYISGALYTLTDPDGNTTTFNYNNCNTGGGCGQLSSVTNALGYVTTYDSYDANGRLLQMTDPNGVVTTYAYDPRGRVMNITQTPPSGSPAITQYSFTPLLAPVTPSANDGDDDNVKDKDNNDNRWWSRWWNKHHHHKRRHYGNTSSSAATTALAPAALSPSLTTSSASWQYSYTPWGDVAQVTDPDGVVLTYGYDAAHYLRTITDGAGNSLRYSYDLKGNRTTDATYDPSGVLARTVSYSYDLRNHLASITSAGNLTAIVNDALGHVQRATDANQHTTQYNYDPLYRLYSILDAANGTTAYGYDVNDRPQAVTAPNNLTTQYSVDDLGNRLQEVSPDRGTITYTYDAAGNVLTQTDARGQIISYTYDALNRVLTKQSSAAFTKPSFYSYDSCYRGRLCSISDGAMPVMNFGYDGFGRMNVSIDVYNGLSSQFAYTAGGRLTSITDPSGRTVTYAYDTVGRVNTVSTTWNGTTTVLASNIAYYPFGPTTTFNFDNGLSYQAHFDTAYRPTTRTDGTYTESITNYDGADNILARTNPGNQSFTYDPLNRLTQGTDNNTGGFGTLAYVYDGNGNRQSETRNGTATNYVYTNGSNWLSQVGSDSRSFNPDGSAASTTALGALSYDGYGDLTNAATAGATYAYDPFGRRDWKEVGSTTTEFAYGPQGELLYETDGTSTKSYVYLNGVPVARIDNNSAVYYYHDDHLGTPQAMTDSTGTTVWKATYEPFGNATVTNQTVTNNLRIPGQYYDSETGLYYNGARYYDPKIGRYISSDPIGLAGGLNTYSYAYNNPLLYIDPLGLSGIDTLYMNDNAPLVVLGRDFGGLAAYAQALLTGNQALANTVAEGLAESRQTNVGTLAVLATMGRGRTSGEMCPTGRNLVIGRGADLAKPGALGPDEYKLSWPSKLPDWQAEWKENAGRMREAMGQRNPIRDASPLDTKGPFLNAERNLLRDRGWTFDPSTNYWNLPRP